MVKTLQRLLKQNDETNYKLYNEINNSLIPEKELELQNQRFYEIQAFIEVNKQKIEQVEKYDELLKENMRLREENESFKRNSEYLKENKDLKEFIEECILTKSMNISLQKELDDEKKVRLSLEKQLNILKQLEGNKINSTNLQLKLLIFSLINRDEVNNFTSNFNTNFSQIKLLNEIFNNSNNNNNNNYEDVNFIRFLGSRVDALEFQNFKLISKHEKYSLLINNYIDELIEFIEVLSDIKNVVNQVFESQALTKEFLIIRETLNSRDEFLEKQKKYFFSEKEKITKELTQDLKYQTLITHDKITDNYLKLLESQKSEGISNLVDEKIQEMQNLKYNLALYEDFVQYREENQLDLDNEHPNKNSFPIKIRESLLNENSGLKVKFLKLKNLFIKLVQNKNIELDDECYRELNSIMNTNIDIIFNEDFFNLIKAQALLVEKTFI